MVTGDGYCEDYLNTLSRIARRLVRREVRRQLMECRTPEAVINVLEPPATPYRQPQQRPSPR